MIRDALRIVYWLVVKYWIAHLRLAARRVTSKAGQIHSKVHEQDSAHGHLAVGSQFFDFHYCTDCVCGNQASIVAASQRNYSEGWVWLWAVQISWDRTYHTHGAETIRCWYLTIILTVTWAGKAYTSPCFIPFRNFWQVSLPFQIELVSNTISVINIVYTK